MSSRTANRAAGAGLRKFFPTCHKNVAIFIAFRSVVLVKLWLLLVRWRQLLRLNYKEEEPFISLI